MVSFIHKDYRSYFIYMFVLSVLMSGTAYYNILGTDCDEIFMEGFEMVKRISDFSTLVMIRITMLIVHSEIQPLLNKLLADFDDILRIAL